MFKNLLVLWFPCIISVSLAIQWAVQSTSATRCRFGGHGTALPWLPGTGVRADMPRHVRTFTVAGSRVMLLYVYGILQL